MRFRSWTVTIKYFLGFGLVVAGLSAFAADDKDNVTYDVPVVVEHRSTEVAPPAQIAADKVKPEKAETEK